MIKNKIKYFSQHVFLQVRSFLLFVTLLLFFTGVGGAQVRTEVRPASPTEGEAFRLTLFVRHQIVDEVSVTLPSFSGGLYLERTSKNPRLVDGSLHTVIEYTLIPNRSGRIRVEPFTVTTPGGETRTAVLNLNVRETRAAIKPFTPKVFWEGVPQQAQVGQRVILELRVQEKEALLPPAEFYMPAVPENAIFASLPGRKADQEDGIAARFIFIPLGGDFFLPSRVLRYENIFFDVPEISVSVLEKDITRGHGGTGDMGSGELGVGSGEPEAGIREWEVGNWENFSSSILTGRIWGRQYKDIFDEAGEHWNKGEYASALAELRFNEREHPAGAYFRPVRKDAEEKLGILNTADESRWKRKLVLAITSVLLLTIITVPFIYFILINKAFWKRMVFFSCTFVLGVAAFVSLYIFMDTRNLFRGQNNKFGVTLETPVRRMADENGQELFKFKEGTPVIVMLNSGAWLYVKSNDTKASHGWVPADAVIFY